MAFVLENDLVFFSNRRFFTKEKPRDLIPDNNPVLLKLPFRIDGEYKNIVNLAEDAILKGSDVYVIGTEVHTSAVSWIIKKNEQRLINGKSPICIYLSGFIDGIDSQYQTPYMSWFQQTADVYKKALPLVKLDEMIQGEKPYVFNALLGIIREHRQILHKILASENGITTMMLEENIDLSSFKDQPSSFIWEGDYNQLKSKTFTVHQIRFHGHYVSISKIIPTEVYAKSRWCVVAETNFESGHVFLTEKTAKPIIAKKPFVIAGNPGTLKFLRSLGFKTFSPWIDESYDTEQDFITRTEMVGNEILKLCKKSNFELDAIDREIEHIVEHNRNHLYSRDWTEVFYNDVYPKLP